MVDPDAVRRRLREIDRRLAALRDIEARGRDVFLGDQAVQAQAERHSQLAIQACIDIALHIVAEDSPQTPEDYASAFIAVARLGLIHDELATRLGSAAGLRNILVHAYLDVDPQRLWAHLQSLGDLERFAEAVERYLRG